MKEKMYIGKSLEEIEELAVKELGVAKEDLYFDVISENAQTRDEVQVQVMVDANPVKKGKDFLENLKWEDIQELHGVIQHRQDDNADVQGRESTLRYHGIFTPDFDLETDKLSNYRVKFVRPYETLYLFIKEYDANNYLGQNQHHITLVMDADKKYFGRQK